MAEEQKKKTKGIGAAIFGGISQGFAKGIGAGFAWILSVLSKIVVTGLGIWGIIAFVWDYFTANFSLTIPIPLMGDVVVKPEPTHYFAGFLNFALGLGFQLGVLALVVFLIFTILTHVPEGTDKPVWRLLLEGLGSLVARGSVDSAKLAKRKTQQGVEELKRRRADAEARRQEAMLAALDEELVIEETEPELAGLDALDEEPSAPDFLPPPETIARRPGKVLKINLPGGKVLSINLPGGG